MAAKLALAALISLGLAIVGIATLGVVGAEASVGAAANTADASQCQGGERREHVAWNAASWLVGLALVVAVGRRGKPAPDESGS